MLRFTCLIALISFAASICAAEAPRYRLTVGRVLYYSGEGTSKEKAPNTPASTSKSTYRFTVIAQNPDGSARVVGRSTSSYAHQGRPGSERVSTALLDLFPDGRYRMDRNLAMSFSPQGVFPRLPAADAPDKTWQSDVDWTGDRTTFTPAAATNNEIVFTGVSEGPTSHIYLTTSKSTYHFDPAKGLVSRVDGEHSQDYGFHSKGTSTLKLDKEEALPADQVQALARDYATFTDAVKRYDEQVKAIGEHPDKAQDMMDGAKAILTAASKKVEHPDVQQEFKSKLEQHDQYAEYSVDSAKRLAAVLNKPAADWSANALAGQTISLQ